VFCDFSLLTTLPDKYWNGGIAEAFKVAMIKDASFYHFLCNNAEKLASRNMPLMEELIQRCAILHLDHIREGGDPFEFGSNRPLDFGHWSAHKLEVLSGYEIGHGQAVSIGMALDVLYASLIGLLSPTECNEFITALSRANLPIYSTLLTLRNEMDQLIILNGLNEFREHLGGELSLTLPNGIGHKTEIHQVDFSLIEKAIHMLQNLDEKQKAFS
jgi:3-dehydroquinate synthase